MSKLIYILSLMMICATRTLEVHNFFEANLLDAHAITSLKDVVSHEHYAYTGQSIPLIGCDTLDKHATNEVLIKTYISDRIVIGSVKHNVNEICYLIHATIAKAYEM